MNIRLGFEIWYTTTDTAELLLHNVFLQEAPVFQHWPFDS